MVGVGCVAFATAERMKQRNPGHPAIHCTDLLHRYAGLLGQESPKQPELNTVATAAMQSGPPQQVNVALVVDTTASMASNDNDPTCGKTRSTVLWKESRLCLQGLTPCAPGFTGSTCTPYDRVSLFTFPAVEASQVSDDTNCKGNNPQIESYATARSRHHLVHIVKRDDHISDRRLFDELQLDEWKRRLAAQYRQLNHRRGHNQQREMWHADSRWRGHILRGCDL